MNTPGGYEQMNWETGYGDLVSEAGLVHFTRHPLAGKDSDGPQRCRSEKTGSPIGIAGNILQTAIAKSGAKGISHDDGKRA